MMEKNYRFKYGSSKKAGESICHFNYYMQDIIPHYFPEASQNFQSASRTLKSAVGKNNAAYFWGRQYVQEESLVDEQSILRSIKSTHLEKKSSQDEILKINESSFQKISNIPGKLFGLLNSGYIASQILQFILKPGQAEKGKKQTYQLYIIHHCQNATNQTNVKLLKWLHYTEKYSFLQEGVLYETVAVAQQQNSYLWSQNNQGVFETFIKNYFKIQKLQGYLLQHQDGIKQKIKMSEDPAFNQEHKLAKQIPVQFLTMLSALKKQFGQEREQLICRYMIARQYKLAQIKTSLKQYLKWQEQYSKYKWEDFEEFHKMNIFYYLGQDYKGRPVILNIAKNVLVNEIDPDKYCKYYMYYLEVHLPQKMRGYVTQLNIIADVRDIGQANFKFAITKRNVDDGKKYCVQRQYKFFAVNISSFAHFAYKFIKPLLPKKTQQKVYIGGNDVKEIFENLNKDMSQDVIPTYLGGKNPLI